MKVLLLKVPFCFAADCILLAVITGLQRNVSEETSRSGTEFLRADAEQAVHSCIGRIATDSIDCMKKVFETEILSYVWIRTERLCRY